MGGWGDEVRDEMNAERNECKENKVMGTEGSLRGV